MVGTSTAEPPHWQNPIRYKNIVPAAPWSSSFISYCTVRVLYSTVPV